MILYQRIEVPPAASLKKYAIFEASSGPLCSSPNHTVPSLAPNPARLMLSHGTGSGSDLAFAQLHISKALA
jgi:hypothetical protein